MIQKALQYLVSLAENKTYEIGGQTYSDHDLHRVVPHIERPSKINFASLDGIVKAIRTEIERVTCPIFVSVSAHDKVEVFTTYRSDNMERDSLYTAIPELPRRPGEWNSYDDAMIILRSRYIQNEGTEYILGLLSHISDDNNVQSNDNGLSQQVTVKQGVSLSAKAAVKPRVVLKPFRTFLEVDQPESEFLLRLRPGDKDKGIEAQIGLFEADGGAWKLDAKHYIAAYFEKSLADLIESGKVVVAE